MLVFQLYPLISMEIFLEYFKANPRQFNPSVLKRTHHLPCLKSTTNFEETLTFSKLMLFIEFYLKVFFTCFPSYSSVFLRFQWTPEIAGNTWQSRV